jgi:hypothetical protein
MPEKTRNLNMEEKRNLQKLIFSDIHAAAEKYRYDRHESRQKLQDRLIEHAPSNVVALFAEYKAADDTTRKIEKELLQLGYVISGYPEKLGIAYNKYPLELVQFDNETSQMDKDMSDLKRDFTLRLFAGGEEAKELFRMLANAIAEIVS